MNGPALVAVLAWSPWGAPPPAFLAFTPGAYVVLFALGLCFGSFLNVVIHRMPRGMSLAFPPSSCPACGHAIRPYDNIPLVSWLVLRGRCRDCAAPISPRYPAVELASGLLLLSLAVFLGPRAALLPAGVFALSLLAIALIDLDHRIIPDELSIGMQRRVAIARALASGTPKVILYDEPTTGLDPNSLEMVTDVILRLREELGMTAIVVTHQLPDALKVGTDYLFLYDRTVHFEGGARDLALSEDEPLAHFLDPFKKSLVSAVENFGLAERTAPR